MDECWLILEEHASEAPTVALNESAPDAYDAEGGTTRFSPIFPAGPLSRKLFRPRPSFTVGFYVHREPAIAMAKLDRNLRKGACYGLGLASLIHIDQSGRAGPQIRRLWGKDLIAWEEWRIKSGRRARSPRTKLAPAATISPDYFALATSSLIDPDTREIVLELRHNLQRFAHLSAQYIPSNFERCKMWTESIQTILNDLRSLANSSAGSSEAALYQQKQIHASIELLVQVNSALVYAISQAFYGAVPISSTRPLMAQHSLLGIGGAWLALRNLCSFIERIFERYPVPLIISQAFGSQAWRDMSDRNLPAINYGEDFPECQPVARIRPKITSYSSRSGFGEIDFVATCASQTLQACSSPRHNMLTMSHELLHAHVKALVIGIFSSSTALETSAIEDEICAAHETWVKYRTGKVSSDNLKLIDSLRFSLIEFVGEYHCCLRRAEYFKRTGKAPVESSKARSKPTVPTSADEFRGGLRASYRFLEEVLVHTLDFHYFYGAQNEVYIDAIWSSWATVPSVLGRLEWYILRTLAPISTLIAPSGENVYYRFEQAVAILRGRLREICDNSASKAVADAALAMLSDAKISHWLSIMFIPTIRLADLAMNFLIDHRISKAFSAGDEAVDWTGDRMTYLLADRSFELSRVLNPVAFLQDRLARGLRETRIKNADEEAAHSAWINLLLSSHNLPMPAS